MIYIKKHDVEHNYVNIILRLDHLLSSTQLSFKNILISSLTSRMCVWNQWHIARLYFGFVSLTKGSPMLH